MPALGTPSPRRFYLDGSALVLKGLKAEDSGAYTCVAHNAAGEDARLHTVSVLGEQPRGKEKWGLCHPTAVGPGHGEGGDHHWGIRRVMPGPGCRRPASSPSHARAMSQATL